MLSEDPGTNFLRSPVNARYCGPVLLVLLCLASLPVYWLGLEGLLAAWSTAEYSHGPIIPLISVYLLRREIRTHPPQIAPIGLRWPGLLIIGCSLALAFIGNLANVADLVAYGIIVLASGVVLTVFGWPRGIRHQLPVLHLVFMLPLPQILYWKVSVFLQGVSSELGVWFLYFAGVPVFLDGNVIDLGIYRLQVAEACSGLRYLFPILSFSYLFAILVPGPIWQKGMLLFAAAPIAILMNSLRIGVMGLLVNSHGTQLAESFLHFFEGWIIFVACVGILFLMAFGLQKLNPRTVSPSEQSNRRCPGLDESALPLAAARPTAALALAVLMVASASGALLSVAGPTAPAIARDVLVLFPGRLGEWSGVKSRLPLSVEETLGASDYLNVTYQKPGSERVSFFVAFYEDQTDGAGIHSPAVCLPAGGWEISSVEPYPISMPESAYGTFELNRAVIQKGLSRQLVYYWFEQRGTRMTNDVLVKATVLWDGLAGGRTDGALVRIVTPISTQESAEDADRRLQEFMRESLPELPRFVPI